MHMRNPDITLFFFLSIFFIKENQDTKFSYNKKITKIGALTQMQRKYTVNINMTTMGKQGAYKH